MIGNFFKKLTDLDPRAVSSKTPNESDFFGQFTNSIIGKSNNQQPEKQNTGNTHNSLPS